MCTYVKQCVGPNAFLKMIYTDHYEGTFEIVFHGNSLYTYAEFAFGNNWTNERAPNDELKIKRVCLPNSFGLL